MVPVVLAKPDIVAAAHAQNAAKSLGASVLSGELLLYMINEARPYMARGAKWMTSEMSRMLMSVFKIVHYKTAHTHVTSFNQLVGWNTSDKCGGPEVVDALEQLLKDHSGEANEIIPMSYLRSKVRTSLDCCSYCIVNSCSYCS